MYSHAVMIIRIQVFRAAADKPEDDEAAGWEGRTAARNTTEGRLCESGVAQVREGQTRSNLWSFLSIIVTDDFRSIFTQHSSLMFEFLTVSQSVI